MDEIVLIVEMYARDGMQEEAEAFLHELLAPSREEPGCLLYAFHRSLADPRRLTFVERWASQAALDEHMAAPHMAAARDRIPALFDSGPVIEVFEAVPGGDPGKGSLAGLAATV